MNDPRPSGPLGPRLSERMQDAVGGLHAPDVLDRAVAHGHRRRTRRRVTVGLGGLAAVTVLGLAAPALVDLRTGQDPASPPVATDPTATGPTDSGGQDATPAADPDAPAVEACGAASAGWWSKSAEEITTQLDALLPGGVRVGRTTVGSTGVWEGTLRTGDGADAASLTLLPPPGVLGPFRTLEEVSRLGPCGGGANAPSVPVEPCEDLLGGTSGGSEERPNVVSCDEVRSADGTVVGVVTEQTTLQVVDGVEQATGDAYRVAVVAGPGGGHVELVVGDSLSTEQLRDVVTDPSWVG